MQKIIPGFFLICVAVLGYSCVIISQIKQADRIQLQIEEQIDPMFNGLMDKVYTGEVFPWNMRPLFPADLETLRYITNIETALRAEMD